MERCEAPVDLTAPCVRTSLRPGTAALRARWRSVPVLGRSNVERRVTLADPAALCVRTLLRPGTAALRVRWRSAPVLGRSRVERRVTLVDPTARCVRTSLRLGTTALRALPANFRPVSAKNALPTRLRAWLAAVVLRVVSKLVSSGLLAGALVVACAGATADEPPAGFAPPDESLFAPGRFVYERNCILCHGRWGDGDGEMGRTVVPKPRKFTSGIFKYRSTPPGFLPTTEDLMRTVRGGRSNTAMPFFSHLSEREIRAVVEYVKSFSSKWRKRVNHAPPVPLPPAPDWLADPVAAAPRIVKGQAAYAAFCSVCHGETADGKGPAAADLRDAWDDPCPPIDLRLPAYRNGRTAEDIFRVLTLGISGTPMPTFGEALSEAQRWELAAYLLTLRPPGASRGAN